MGSMRLNKRLVVGLGLGLVTGVVAAWCSTWLPRENDDRVMAEVVHSHYHVHGPDIDHGHLHVDFVTGGHTHEHAGH